MMDESTMILSKIAENYPGDEEMAYIVDKVIEEIHG